MSGARDRIRARLYDGFRERPSPLLRSAAYGIPGASLWTASRQWVGCFRALGLEAGDRVAIALDRDPAHVSALIAAWWEGLVPCLVPPADDPEAWRVHLDARVALARAPGPHTVLVGEHWDPVREGSGGPAAAAAATPHLAAILVDDPAARPGAAGPSACPALTAEELDRILDREPPLPEGAEPRVSVSVLAWHRLAGGPADLWTALAGGMTIVADLDLGADPRGTGALLAAHEADRLVAPAPLARTLLDGPHAHAAVAVAGLAVAAADDPRPVSAPPADGWRTVVARPGVVPGLRRAHDLACRLAWDRDRGVVPFPGAAPTAQAA